MEKAIDKPKKRNPPETLSRISFLYKTANHLVRDQKLGSRPVATHLSHLSVAVGKKAVIRSCPEVKKSICKGCHGLLVLGKTAFAKVVGKSKRYKHIILTCRQCDEKKKVIITPPKGNRKNEV